MKTILLAALAGAMALSAQAETEMLVEEEVQFTTPGPRGSLFALEGERMFGENPVAAVLITRQDSSATLMEMMFRCASNEYVYLGMDHSPVLPVTDTKLALLASQSDSIITTNLNGVIFSPITDDPYDAPMAALSVELCSAS